MNCSICNSNFTTPVGHIKKDEIYYIFSICKSCSFVFQYPRYERTHYLTLPCSFPSDYDDHAKRRAKYIFDFIGKYKNSFFDGNILDVGCGSGKVLENFQSLCLSTNDFQSYGYSLHFQNYNPSNSIIIQKDVEIDKLENRKYKIIMLTHVLEHFYYPYETLLKLSNLLDNDGIMYIEVPSYHKGEIRINNIYTPEHLSYFTRNSLINIINKSGMGILKIHDSNYWGNIKAICAKTYPIRKIKKIDYRYDIIYHNLHKITYPFYKLIKKTNKIGPNE